MKNNNPSSQTNDPKKKNTSPSGSAQRNDNAGGADVPESDDTLGENAGGNFSPDDLASDEEQRITNTESGENQVPSHNSGKDDKSSSNPNSDDELGENAGGNFSAGPTAQEERLSREGGDNPTASSDGTEPGSEDDLKSLPGFGTDDDRKEK